MFRNSTRKYSWWKDVNYVCDGRDNWFCNNLRHIVGNDNDISFRCDLWLLRGRLCDRFSWLIELVVDKNISVNKKCALGWGLMGRHDVGEAIFVC